MYVSVFLPRMCSETFGNDRVGAFVAAEMWNSAVVDATTAAVAAELEAPSIWIRGRTGEPSEHQITLMFDAARQAATFPLVELDEPTWNARCDAIGEAQASRSGIYVSAITAWEVATLVRKERYRLLVSPKIWFSRLLALVGIRLAELTPEVLIDSTELPGTPPADPADRMIVATARHHGFVSGRVAVTGHPGQRAVGPANEPSSCRAAQPSSSCLSAAFAYRAPLADRSRTR